MSNEEQLSQLELLAKFLSDSDFDMRTRLVELRRLSGLNQTEVGSRMGISQEAVAAFERYDNDPKLSTIRRYALAIGAQIGHSVEKANDTMLEHSETITGIVNVAGFRWELKNDSLSEVELTNKTLSATSNFVGV
jgi:transcriptional regulator with XRE-family HTH domain